MVEVFLDASEKNVCIPKFMAIAKSITKKISCQLGKPKQMKVKGWAMDTTLTRYYTF